MDPDIEKATEIITDNMEHFKDADLEFILKMLGRCNDLLRNDPKRGRKPYVMPWTDPLMQPYVQEGMAAMAQSGWQFTAVSDVPDAPIVPEKTTTINGRKFVFYRLGTNGGSASKPVASYEDRQEALTLGTIFHYAHKGRNYILNPATGIMLVLHGDTAKKVCGETYPKAVDYINNPDSIPEAASVAASVAAPSDIPKVKKAIPKPKVALTV